MGLCHQDSFLVMERKVASSADVHIVRQTNHRELFSISTHFPETDTHYAAASVNTQVEQAMYYAELGMR